MRIEVTEPGEDDSVDCHLQQIGMRNLVCRAAEQTALVRTVLTRDPGDSIGQWQVDA